MKFSSCRISRRTALARLAGFAGFGVAPLPDFRLRPGEINHLALTVTDPARSRDFYRRLLGMRVLEDQARFCRLGLQRNAVTLVRGATPGLQYFSLCVEADEPQRIAAALRAHGCLPVEEQPGRWFVADPDAVRVHVSRPEFLRARVSAAYAQHPAPDSVFQAVDVNHLALQVPDLDRSREFYRQLFDLPVARQDANSCFLGIGSNFLALFRGRKAGGLDHFCFSIENYAVERVTAVLEQEGRTPRREHNRVYFHDPDGLTVQLSPVSHMP